MTLVVASLTIFMIQKRERIDSVMIFGKDDVVYYMPIRYWEDKEPIKCIVREETKTSEVHLLLIPSDSVLVYSEAYGHDIYVNRRSLFFSEAKCREAIELYSKLKEVYFQDECDMIFNKIMEDEAYVVKERG